MDGTLLWRFVVWLTAFRYKNPWSYEMLTGSRDLESIAKIFFFFFALEEENHFSSIPSRSLSLLFRM
jgi:hypothetical protein